MHFPSLLVLGAALVPSVFSSPIVARCTGPDVNAATIALIKQFEGFVPNVYKDPVGLPTVGYGHLCKTAGCGEVPYPFPLSEENATKLMKADLKSFQQTITLKTASHVTLNANQYGALVSWAFNVGSGAVGTSTLLARLNAGENEATVIAQELPRWNKAGGKVLAGLTRRRAAEVALAQTSTSAKAIPACS
ncbi:glycoside hydrolase family 24 protein [Sporormia fimetaria CBS 119925]|uniref:Glycoside hydrolase family 24 protein n=1 Tax=Sporormia fimetaria CBS 119925 TaxID=1340428 RepID=A0A6A6VHZ6_9PLEO|nr:glycoside hydrolase family 24 protein [Sporormia fimetaria CBS 119925]